MNLLHTLNFLPFLDFDFLLPLLQFLRFLLLQSPLHYQYFHHFQILDFIQNFHLHFLIEFLQFNFDFIFHHFNYHSLLIKNVLLQHLCSKTQQQSLIPPQTMECSQNIFHIISLLNQFLPYFYLKKLTSQHILNILYVHMINE